MQKDTKWQSKMLQIFQKNKTNAFLLLLNSHYE